MSRRPLDPPTPHDLEAEKAVLGAILVNQDKFFEVADTIGPRDFFRDAHRKIFFAMYALASQGEKLDIQTVGSFLSDRNELEDVGSYAYLSGLCDGVPRSSNADAYARIVAAHSLRAGLIRAAASIADRTHEGADTKELLDFAQEQIFGLSNRTKGDFVAPGDFSQLVYTSVEKLVEGEGTLGVPTGWIDLDEKLMGLRPGHLIFIAGRPSMGKTALALNLADHVAREQQKVVGFFSLEMTAEELGLRWLSSLADVNTRELHERNLSELESGRIGESVSAMANAKLFIDDTADLGLFDLRSKCRRLQAKHGLDLVVIDYLQLMQTAKAENRNNEIAKLSRGLKIVAKELGVPIVALSQLSRASEARADKTPMLSDLRDSGALEQDADLVLFVHRPEVYEPGKPDLMGVAEIIISKQRNGPLGTVKLTWLRRHQKFVNAG